MGYAVSDDFTEKAAAGNLNLHYERSVHRHVLFTFYIDTGIEGRKRPFGDLPKDDIDNHEVHWWRSRVIIKFIVQCGSNHFQPFTFT
jgi:hypothetical protein